jgi:beta-lactamase regulating signal transducer with metallopeptidase domain
MNPQLNVWIYTIGWALIHFVWQGGLIALATAAALASCRHRSSEARYAIACAGLVAMLAAPAITASVVGTSDQTIAPGGSASPTVSTSASPSPAPPTARLQTASLSLAATAARTASTVERWLPIVVWVWLSGVMLLLARFAGASFRVRRLRLASLKEPLSPWQSTGERLAAQLRLDVGFRIVESALVDAPSVIGTMRPIIFLPVTALTGLAPHQIEALIAHELAHIRRRDYAVNIAQTVAEALLFFHPAVWWISARIRQEREHCCDDVAVETCGEPVDYAAALAELAAWRSRDLALSVGAADGPLLARVRRVLRAPSEDAPRPSGGLAVLALGLLVSAGAIVNSASQKPLAPAPASTEQTILVKTRSFEQTWSLKRTDHFEVYYPQDLDLHAERAAEEAERAYERVSGDLRHNLAFRVPIFLFRTTSEFDANVRAGASLDAASEPSGDRILLAIDQPADRWPGLITHEVAHIFAFDILPGRSTATWVLEGLAEYERGAWDPSDLAAIRNAVRANAVPPLSRLQADDPGAPRLVSAFGHAAFDFIESRSGKAGVRQFLFALRQAAGNGADPFQAALQLRRDEFDQAFESYLRDRFAAVARQLPASRLEQATTRVEGDITSVGWPVATGLACIELWVPVEGATRQLWAVECGTGTGQDLIRALKPGDRVVVTGPLARGVTAQRLTLESLTRPADGLTWRAASQ